MASDACLEGCGSWFNGKFFHTTFPQFIVDMNFHINALELITIVVAVKLWGAFLKGKKLVVNTDSSVSCQVLNSGFSRDHFLQSCLREICFYAALHEFQIKANFIQGVSNRIPDWLSRWHLKPSYKSMFYESVKNEKLEEYFVDTSLFRFSHDW